MEWVPGTMEIRLIGVFDGKRYRWYRRIEDFLNCELTRENRGKWFYAHAGGLADIQFLFEFLIGNPNYAVKASFSGSSAIIVHIGKGESSRNALRYGNSLGHDLFHFVDSYWLLRDTLRNIGKSIGLEKGGEELMNDGNDEERIRAWFRNVSLTELAAYNEQDCYILWHAINQMQHKLWEFGGQLQMTLASSAMHLFRRKYLTENIVTDERVNEIARKAYVASRVEKLETYVQDSWYHDVNSSFPFSMTKPLPGQCVGGTYGKLPKSKNALYIADCEVDVQESYFPPLPYRAGGRVFFPTGRWRAWFSNVDLEILERARGKVHRVHGVYSFSPFTDLAEYAQSLYEKRKASKDDFEKYCYKLLLNSLYGKFAESDMKTGVYVNPSSALMETFDPELTQQLLPGVFLHPEMIPVPHMHVPISCHTTAYSRGLLQDFATIPSTFPHYLDTDGFSTDEWLRTGKDLGDLKLEKYFAKAEFIQPKVYHGTGWELKDDEWKQITVTKAKGFSLGRDKKKAEELFMKLVDSGEIRVTRMERVRSLLKNAGTEGLHPYETEVTKRINKNTMGKRFLYPDGSTRPWSVREIQSAYGP